MSHGYFTDSVDKLKKKSEKKRENINLPNLNL